MKNTEIGETPLVSAERNPQLDEALEYVKGEFILELTMQNEAQLRELLVLDDSSQTTEEDVAHTMYCSMKRVLDELIDHDVRHRLELSGGRRRDWKSFGRLYPRPEPASLASQLGWIYYDLQDGIAVNEPHELTFCDYVEVTDSGTEVLRGLGEALDSAVSDFTSVKA